MVSKADGGGGRRRLKVLPEGERKPTVELLDDVAAMVKEGIAGLTNELRGLEDLSEMVVTGRGINPMSVAEFAHNMNRVAGWWTNMFCNIVATLSSLGVMLGGSPDEPDPAA